MQMPGQGTWQSTLGPGGLPTGGIPRLAAPGANPTRPPLKNSTIPAVPEMVFTVDDDEKKRREERAARFANKTTKHYKASFDKEEENKPTAGSGSTSTAETHAADATDFAGADS